MEKILKDLPNQTAADFVSALANAAFQRSEFRRKAIQNHSPVDVVDSLSYSKLPGKLGHMAAVAFKVGRLTTSYPVSRPTSWNLNLLKK